MSKQTLTIQKEHTYTIEYFERINIFTVKRKSSLFQSEYVIHSGSFKKLWQFKYIKESSLKEFLKRWYPKHTKMSFYTHLNYAIKHQDNSQFILIIRQEQEIDKEWLSYSLKKTEKKNSSKTRRVKRYYCGCFHCTGTSKERFEQIKSKDDLLFFKD